MKMNDVQIGHTYADARFEKQKRTVVAIGREFQPGYKPQQSGGGKRHRAVVGGKFSNDFPGVLFREHGFNFDQKMGLDAFAKWAGCDVTSNVEFCGGAPLHGAASAGTQG